MSGAVTSRLCARHTLAPLLHSRGHRGRGGQAAVAAAASPHAALLTWASNALHSVKAEVRELPGVGRGLVASEDLQPGQVILSVPYPAKVFASLPEPACADMYWASEAALRLLRARADWRARGGNAPMAPWLASLPEDVHTPLEWDDDEVAALPSPSFRADVTNLQEVVGACYFDLEAQLVDMGAGWPDFRWAVQVLHSRCFFVPALQQHLAVPGIDIANHSAAANATVQLVTSPDTCQGADAAAEVAPPPTGPPASSAFQLVAGPDGIPAGQEVTICYGGWPAEVFTLMFGFVPAPLGSGGGHGAGGADDCDPSSAAAGQPASEAVELFQGPGELVAFVRAQLEAGGPAMLELGGAGGASGGSGGGGGGSHALNDAQWQEVASAVEDVLQASMQRAGEMGGDEGEGGGPWQGLQLVATAAGPDARLGPALAAARDAVGAALEQAAAGQPGAAAGAAAGRPISSTSSSKGWQQVLAARRLEQVAGAHQEAMAALPELGVQYSRAKLRVLQHALASVTEGS